MNETLYKILVNGRACHGGDFAYSLPTEKNGIWTPGDWHKVEGKTKLCSNGFHLTDKPGKWMKWGAEMYEVEAKGVGQWDRDDAKCVASSVRLTKKAEMPEYWQRAVKFVNEELPAVKWFQPSAAPSGAWKLFLGSDVAAARAAAWDAARDAAWDAAWAAARAAAWAAARDAAWDAARAAAGDAAWAAAWAAAWDAARDAARAAAWDAARDAARAAARDAAWDAARDAARACNFRSIVHDLDIDQKHRDHVASRWSAWTSGYGVSCDVDGVLYCYARGEWLSVEAVSDKLKASSAAVKNYCAAGLIPHAKLVKESRGDVWQIPSVGLIGFEKPKRGGAAHKK